MRITARFNGKCAKCGKPTLKGTEIEYQNKQAFHAACAEEEPTGGGDDQLQLAEKLGFEHYDWDRLLRLLPGVDHCGSTGRDERAALGIGDSVWDVRESTESEED